MDESLVLPNRKSINLKHNHNMAAGNTRPPPINDLRAKMGVSFMKMHI